MDYTFPKELTNPKFAMMGGRKMKLGEDINSFHLDVFRLNFRGVLRDCTTDFTVQMNFEEALNKSEMGASNHSLEPTWLECPSFAKHGLELLTCPHCAVVQCFSLFLLWPLEEEWLYTIVQVPHQNIGSTNHGC